jgi:sugar phosphate isomerase/epimerase
MVHVSNMAWRIGEVLDIGRQLDWIEENGFDAVSFHASPGTPGKWQGIPLADLREPELERLRRRLSAFQGVEVHAPFDHQLRQPDEGTFDALLRVCRAAAAIGAGVVTVHSRQPGLEDGQAREIWRGQLGRLSETVAQTPTRIGLELTGAFDILGEVDAPAVGITLDVGHMYQKDVDGRLPLEPSQKLGPVIESLDGRLVHLHMHDYNGTVDHIELGCGFLDFVDVFSALRSIGYHGMLCLEMNPDRVTPEGMLRSARFIRTGMG